MKKELEKKLKDVLESGHEVTICKRDDGWFYVESKTHQAGDIEGASATLDGAFKSFFAAWDKQWLEVVEAEALYDIE